MADTKMPCWVLTNDAGDDLLWVAGGVQHFASEAVAVENAMHLADGGFGPRQLDKPCITIACSCCDTVYDEEEEGVAHWADQAEAEQALAGSWEFADGVAKCDACKAGLCDAERGDHG